MAKSSIETKSVKRYLEKKLKRISSPTIMKRLGRESIKLIKKRTRLQGQGVDRPEGRASKLKKVTEKYAKRRQAIKGKHRKAAKGRDSNLTLTGSMLDSLYIIQASRGPIFIGNNNKLDSIKTAAHHEKGRPYLYLSRKEMVEILKRYDTYVKNIISES